MKYKFKRLRNTLGGLYAGHQLVRHTPATGPIPIDALNLATDVYGRTFKNKRVRYGKAFSGGKFAKGKRFKKKTYKRHVAGVHLTIEKGGVKGSDEQATPPLPGAPTSRTVNTIGHITSPLSQVYYMLAFALAKKFSVYIRRPFENINELIVDMTSGHQFYFTYQRSGGSNTPINVVFVSVTPGTTTWATFVSALSTQLLALTSPFMLQKIVSLDGSNNSDYMVVTDAVFSLYAKSSLKIQNQTVTEAADDNADDVNNVPLYGKSYEGYGTGTYIIPASSVAGAVNAGYFGDKVNGVIERNVLAAENPVNEPPIGYEFMKKAKIGKAHLEPGQIKTSVLYHKINININKFFLKYQPRSQETLDDPDRVLGKFRFFAMEKMIETAPLASRAEIVIAYEHNLSMHANIKLKSQNKTSRVFIDYTA